MTVICTNIGGRAIWSEADCSGYHTDVTCGRCGGELHQIAGGRPVARSEISSVARCADCGWEWVIKVFLRSVRGAQVTTKPTHRPTCGSNAGYTAHLRASEAACRPCLVAHSTYTHTMTDRRELTTA